MPVKLSSPVNTLTMSNPSIEEKKETMIAKLPDELAEDYAPKNIMVTGGAGTYRTPRARERETELLSLLVC